MSTRTGPLSEASIYFLACSAWLAIMSFFGELQWAALPLALYFAIDSLKQYLVNSAHSFQRPAASNQEVLPLGDAALDVFITVVNEPLELVSSTINSAKKIDWGQVDVYLLDDGNLPAFKELASTLGVHYISRSDRKGNKAGNINHALGKTQAPLILVLDSDSLVSKDIVKKALPYFARDVWAVQFNGGPRNLDSAISSPLNSWCGGSWYDIKYRINEVNQLMNKYSVAMWRGSGAILRRECLDAIGGVQEDTVVEDSDTSLKFITQTNYRLEYVFDDQCYSILDPMDHLSYFKQRTRWAIGRIQICFKYLLSGRLGWQKWGLLALFRNEYFFFTFKSLSLLSAVNALPQYSPGLVCLAVILPFFERFLKAMNVHDSGPRFIFVPLAYEYYNRSICFTAIGKYLASLVNGKKIGFQITHKDRRSVPISKIALDIEGPSLAFTGLFIVLAGVLGGRLNLSNIIVYHVLTMAVSHSLIWAIVGPGGRERGAYGIF